jgi:phospholipid-binding lipoprotein MlaA
MQGEVDRAVVTIGRFAINSTAGLGGLIDVAAKMGIDGHREDFGQTLAVWGSGEGPYLMLPLLGPSNPRDVTGLVVDGFIDPVPYFVSTDVQLARTLVRGVDERERVLDALDEIERTSLDFYATLRSLYRQRRADEIRNGAQAPVVPIPAISIEEFEDTDEGQISMVN